jgi:hypothetical protein
MIKEQVEKTMKKALVRFSENENITANRIAFFIHTKNDDLSPAYFYAIDGKPVKDEQGELVHLRFVQDILNRKMDLLGTEYVTKQFLSNYYKTYCSENKINPKMLYVMITSADEEAKKLSIALYNGNQVLNDNMKLDQIFGE